jgi:hypothetical protein
MTAVLASINPGQEAAVREREGQGQGDESSVAQLALAVPGITLAEDLQEGSQGPATSSEMREIAMVGGLPSRVR